jgi:hypothetical protein
MQAAWGSPGGWAPRARCTRASRTWCASSRRPSTRSPRKCCPRKVRAGRPAGRQAAWALAAALQHWGLGPGRGWGVVGSSTARGPAITHHSGVCGLHCTARCTPISKARCAGSRPPAPPSSSRQASQRHTPGRPPPAGPTALIFGREESGLSEGELRLCRHACAIPTGRYQGSMNLSHAVAVVLAQCFDRRLELLELQDLGLRTSGEGRWGCWAAGVVAGGEGGMRWEIRRAGCQLPAAARRALLCCGGPAQAWPPRRRPRTRSWRQRQSWRRCCGRRGR